MDFLVLLHCVSPFSSVKFCSSPCVFSGGSSATHYGFLRSRSARWIFHKPTPARGGKALPLYVLPLQLLLYVVVPPPPFPPLWFVLVTASPPLQQEIFATLQFPASVSDVLHCRHFSGETIIKLFRCTPLFYYCFCFSLYRFQTDKKKATDFKALLSNFCGVFVVWFIFLHIFD